METLTTNPFTSYDDILVSIGFGYAEALEAFTMDFEEAYTRYDDNQIIRIFDFVLNTNIMKYKKLAAAANAEYNPIHNYDMEESGADIRTPDLTNTLTLATTSKMTDTRSTTTDGNNSTNTLNQINQTRTTIESPEDYGEITTHKVNPYDNPGLVEEYQDTMTQTGKRQIEESYSGNADTSDTTVTGSSTTKNSGGTSTTNSGTNTQTETGTDTTSHTLTRKGNIGVTTTQKMLEDELALADKMNIFKIIEQDIAAKIFIQVW